MRSKTLNQIAQEAAKYAVETLDFQTEDEKVYFFEPLEKEISVEDMQKIVDANEKLVKEMKDGNK